MKKVDWNRAKAESGWIVSAVLALTLVGTVLAISPSFPTGPVGPGSFVSTASYTVFSDGSNFFVKNGKSAAIDLSTSSAYSAIQYALNQTGTILIRAGDYSINHCMSFHNDNTYVEGEGQLTHLDFTAAAVCAFLIDTNYWSVSNLWADGSATGVLAQGIEGTGAYGMVQNVYMTGWVNGIIFNSVSGSSTTCHDIQIDHNWVLSASAGAVEMDGCTNSAITNNIIHKSNGTVNPYKNVAIELHGYDTAHIPINTWTRGITISGNVLIGDGSSSNYGLYLWQASQDVSVTGNVFNHFATAIVMDANSTSTSSKGISISGNFIFNSSYSGILVQGSYFSDLSVTDNSIINSNATAIYISTKGDGLIVSGNSVDKVNWNIGYGIYVASNIRAPLVTGNYVNNTGLYGIFINSNSPNYTVTMNVVTYTQNFGIVAYSGNGTISYNTVINFGNNKGIYFTNNAVYVMVIGNRLRGTGTGVSSGTADYTYLFFNNFKGCTTAYSLTGSHNEIGNNTST